MSINIYENLNCVWISSQYLLKLILHQSYITLDFFGGGDWFWFWFCCCCCHFGLEKWKRRSDFSSVLIKDTLNFLTLFFISCTHTYAHTHLVPKTSGCTIISAERKNSWRMEDLGEGTPRVQYVRLFWVP